MYPYGDTRNMPRPGPLPDDGDERAARWTLRFLAGALFVAVLAVTTVVSLVSVHGDPAPAMSTPPPEVVTTLPPAVDVGPTPGIDVAPYIQSRRQALAAVRDERVAVVSLAKYSTETQARAIIGTLPVVALLVAPAGVAPAAVTTDLASWAKAQTASNQSDLDEIKKLLPTVDDPTFKSFYQSEVVRLTKALQNFAPDGPIVFGVVVHGPAAALQALGARSDVRLVDVAATAQVDPRATYRGLRPEEVTTANTPPLRPV